MRMTLKDFRRQVRKLLGEPLDEIDNFDIAEDFDAGRTTHESVARCKRRWSHGAAKLKKLRRLAAPLRPIADRDDNSGLRAFYREDHAS